MWAWRLLACAGSADDEDPRTEPLVEETADTAGTTEDTAALPPVITSGPTVSLPEVPNLRLVRILTVTSDVPTAASVVLDDGARRRRVTFPGLATTHALPLLALRQDTPYDVELTLADEAGRAVVATTTFRTEEVAELLPRLELLVNEPTAEPGLRVLPADGDVVPTVIVAVDLLGEVVWAWVTDGDTKAVSFEPSTGRLSWLNAEVVWRITPGGEGAVLYASEYDSAPPGAIVVPVPSFHHEAAFEADGSFWSLYKENRLVEDYPLSEADPSITGPTTIQADVVFHAAADGSLLGAWHLADLFPPERVGYDSFLVDRADWSHANAVVPLPGEDAFLVSMRHQDTVARVRASTGTVEWILANHDGWPASHQPLLLEPVGAPFGWPYHQHAPALDPQGGIWLFDNGNDHRTTPYSQDPQPGPLFSRVVRYEVDPAARIVRQANAFVDLAASPLFSFILGNADPLPVTGHVLATFAALGQEGGVINADAGRGTNSSRVREFDPATGSVVWDLRVSSAREDLIDGYKTDRVIAIPSLYAADVVEEWLDR